MFAKNSFFPKLDPLTVTGMALFFDLVPLSGIEFSFVSD
jgi:hypothetical protein